MRMNDEISIWAKAGLAVSGVFLWLWKNVLVPFKEVQSDIKTIKSNHLTHLEGYAQEIKNLKVKDAERDDQHHEVIERLSRIEGKIS